MDIQSTIPIISAKRLLPIGERFGEIVVGFVEYCSS